METIKKARTNRKDSDYLRFRPYHAFTTQQTKVNRWTVLPRIAVIVGFLALLIFSGKFLLLAIT
jgi:hypothetical protein